MSEQPPILPIPTWAVAIGVASFFGICMAVGYMKNAENLNPSKKEKKGKNTIQEVEKLLSASQPAIKKGNFDEAEALLLEALPHIDKIPPPANLQYAYICNRQLANIFRIQKKYDLVEKHLLRTLSVFEGRDLETEEEEAYSDSYELLIETYYNSKNEEKAAMHLIKWASFLEKRRTTNARKRVPTLYLLIGKHYMDKKNASEAEEYFLKGVKAVENTPSGLQTLPKDDMYFQLQFFLLQALAVQKKKQDVLKLIPKLTSSFEAKEPLEIATFLDAISIKLFDIGEYEESLKHLDKVSNIFERLSASSSGRESQPIASSIYEIQTRRSAALSALGKIDEARNVMTSLAKRVRGVPPAMTSKYLTTTSSYVHKGDENFIKFEADLSGENKLPSSSLLVVKFETDDGQILEIDHEIGEGSSSVTLHSPSIENVREDKYYLIDISIFKDNTKSEIIGTHYQLARVLSEPEKISQEEVKRRLIQNLIAGELE